MRARRRLVFTNGVFDFLHAGHVRYLAQARELGDLLIVGVNDDASVRRLGKGGNRPYNVLGDRISVLEALRAVDGAVAFAKDTPWVHVDLAGPASVTTGRPSLPRGGTGFAVATIVDYLTHR